MNRFFLCVSAAAILSGAAFAAPATVKTPSPTTAKAPAAAKPAAVPVQAEPDLTVADLNRQGDAAAKSGNSLAAIQLYQSAIILAPADPAGYIRLGQFYAAGSQADNAYKYFGIALDIDPTNAPALKGVALLDVALGNLADARVQRDLLVRACGQACPEVAQINQALAMPGTLDTGGTPN